MRELKRILVGTAFLFFATSSQAALVETIANYATGDIVTAQTDVQGGTTEVRHFNDTTTFLDNAYTDAVKTLQTGIVFDHVYLFEVVSNGYVALSLVTENRLSDPILDFTLTIMGSGGFATIVDNTSPLSLAFQMVAGESYTIGLTGTATGNASDYRLEVSSVPVPAAVWLFGSALLGLAGLRRKSKMDAVSA